VILLALATFQVRGGQDGKSAHVDKGTRRKGAGKCQSVCWEIWVWRRTERYGTSTGKQIYLFWRPGGKPQAPLPTKSRCTVPSRSLWLPPISNPNPDDSLCVSVSVSRHRTQLCVVPRSDLTEVRCLNGARGIRARRRCSGNSKTL
jgi:hypothetical protein